MTKDLRLTYEDRCQIHALWKRGFSHAEIAWDIAVHRTTIWRELRRNSMSTGYYIHCAQEKAEERQQRRRCFPRKMTPKLIAFIEAKLKQGWSPEQISGWLKHRQNKLPAVSHERIYQHVWRNPMGWRKTLPASAPSRAEVQTSRHAIYRRAGAYS